MVGVIIATHSELSEGVVKTSEVLLGKQNNVKVLTLHVGDSIQAFREQMEAELISLRTCEGVVVLVDMLGGSPYNVAFSLLQTYDFQLITGVNLPMLLHVLTKRESSRNEAVLACECLEAAKESITLLNRDMIKKMQQAAES